MPRRSRLTLPNVPLHLIQRGNNRQVCFVADEDFRLYLDWLAEYAGKTGCRVHAYVQYFNRTYRRSGSLWEGRFRSLFTVYSD
jgi:putative transposase